MIAHPPPVLYSPTRRPPQLLVGIHFDCAGLGMLSFG
jgi:hypothetical protein